jgi:F0F1-type ATP synthase membrane subunit b/b'
MVLAIIFFQGVVFIALIFILRHFMKGHVSGAVDHLHKLNDELMKQQAELKQKMAESQREYEAKMAKLNEEVQTKQKQSKEEAIKSLEESREKAMGEREKIINEAVQTRDKMRQEIMAEMEQQAIGHSKTIIAEWMTGELAVKVNEYLLQEALDALKEADMKLFQIKSDSAELRLTQPLDSATKQKILKILKDKIGNEVELKEKQEADLLAGIIINFGTFVIDGSLSNRLAEAAARLKQESKRRYQKTQ